MIPVSNPCSIHLPPAPQESPGHQILRWYPWGAAWCQVSTWSLLPPSPPCSCQLCLIQTLLTAPSSSRVTSLKEQSGFGAVSASPDSCSWPSQQLGRGFQVLAVSVLLLPWLQTSPITLVWFSWLFLLDAVPFSSLEKSPALQKLKLWVMGFITSAQNLEFCCVTLISSLFLILWCLALSNPLFKIYLLLSSVTSCSPSSTPQPHPAIYSPPLALESNLTTTFTYRWNPLFFFPISF